jgi:hypothetical protein
VPRQTVSSHRTGDDSTRHPHQCTEELKRLTYLQRGLLPSNVPPEAPVRNGDGLVPRNRRVVGPTTSVF